MTDVHIGNEAAPYPNEKRFRRWERAEPIHPKAAAAFGAAALVAFVVAYLKWLAHVDVPPYVIETTTPVVVGFAAWFKRANPPA